MSTKKVDEHQTNNINYEKIIKRVSPEMVCFYPD